MKEIDVAANHEKAAEVYNGVSTLDVPNAAWGYSAVTRKWVQIAGWGVVVLLLCLNFGNHKGHVETIWLIALAVLVAVGLILFAFEPKLHQVRTLTGKNQPVGHHEPDWPYDQKTLSGAYSNLTDDELRSLNIEPSRVRSLNSGAHTAFASDAASHAATSEVGKHEVGSTAYSKK